MSGTADSTELWRDAFRALTAFALAPERLGGVRLRMPAGPARDAVLQVLRGLLDPSVLVRRLPVAATDETLDGGPDLAASLETGRLVRSRGLLMAEAPLLLIVPMAERLEPRVAGHLVRALDAQAAAPLLIVACDEGREADETPPDALCERLALTLDLTALQQVPARTTLPSQADLALARGRAQALLVSDEMVEAACLAAAALGIPSLRAPAFAIRFAQLIAALEDRPSVLAEDLAFAARFVLGPRTRAVPVPPAQPADSQAEDATEPRNGETHDASPDTQVDTPPAAGGAPEDLVVAAAAALASARRCYHWSGCVGTERSRRCSATRKLRTERSRRHRSLPPGT